MAAGHPEIAKASDGLTRLSLDPKARELARWREDQLFLYRTELARVATDAHEQGLERGRDEGLKTGIERGRDEGASQKRLSWRGPRALAIAISKCS